MPSLARGSKGLEYVAKPAATLLLVGVAIAIVPEDDTRVDAGSTVRDNVLDRCCRMTWTDSA